MSFKFVPQFLKSFALVALSVNISFFWASSSFASCIIKDSNLQPACEKGDVLFQVLNRS